jgi:hypothetical protein
MSFFMETNITIIHVQWNQIFLFFFVLAVSVFFSNLSSVIMIGHTTQTHQEVDWQGLLGGWVFKMLETAPDFFLRRVKVERAESTRESELCCSAVKISLFIIHLVVSTCTKKLKKSDS